MLSEPPWAVWGLIYMIIGCFDDTPVIISTDWSRAEQLWQMIWYEFDWRVLSLLKRIRGCFCAHAAISAHPRRARHHCRCLPPSAQPRSTELPDYSHFSSNSDPSMPNSWGRSLIRQSRPQPAPSLECTWWWRSIRLSEGLYIQEADLAQPATDADDFPGKVEVKIGDQTGEQGWQKLS